MANTLTGLIPTIYTALDVVSREQVGFIPAVRKDSLAEGVALGQVVTWPVVPPTAASDITPGASGPTGVDNSIATPQVTISKSRSVKVYLTGEEDKGLRQTGNKKTIRQNQLSQAFRTLSNEIEADLAITAKQNASRAYGTAGTTPFGTSGDLSDLAQMYRILLDNGAPGSNLKMVLNTIAGANIRGKQGSLFKVNEAGTDALLRNGSLGRLMGFDMGESGQISTHTKGTGSAYVTSGATAPKVTDIALVTGANPVLAGDVATFAADTINKYVVNVGVTAPGTISLGKPGAMITIPTGNAMTIGNSYNPSFGFDSDSLLLLSRIPASPEEGDSAIDSMLVQDPFTGLIFELRLYAQYRQIVLEIGIAWGTKAVKTENIAILLG